MATDRVIAIVDYGASNLRSVMNAFRAIGEDPLLAQDAESLRTATAIVMPGVGAFGEGIDNLRQSGLISALNEAVLEQRKPFLGICLGLQLLGKGSSEHGSFAGLGWIDGHVEKLAPESDRFRVPHMGWNHITIERHGPLFSGLDEEPIFYFLHSYQLVEGEGCGDLVTATCFHGQTITAAVQKDNIHAVQFHPEKSQDTGLKLLRNFVDLI